jgi:hypothetical protein
MYSKQTRPNKNSSSAHTAATNQFASPKFIVQPQMQEGAQQHEPISAAEVEKIRAAGSNWPDVSMFTTNRPAPAPRPRIQRKLSIGKVGDKYEQEADNVARQVVDQIHAPQSPSVQRQQQKDEEIQTKPIANAIQRQEAPEDDIQTKPLANTIQRQEQTEEETPVNAKGQALGVDSETASENLETSIQQAKGGGQPLAESVRQPMEKAFGADFSGVKFHTDTRSDQLSQSIQAKAFTTGKDVFFKSGEYNPGSKSGQELIAHELTHVVQQGGSAKIQRKTPTTPQKRTSSKIGTPPKKGANAPHMFAINPSTLGHALYFQPLPGEALNVRESLLRVVKGSGYEKAILMLYRIQHYFGTITGDGEYLTHNHKMLKGTLEGLLRSFNSKPASTKQVIIGTYSNRSQHRLSYKFEIGVGQIKAVGKRVDAESNIGGTSSRKNSTQTGMNGELGGSGGGVTATLGANVSDSQETEDSANITSKLAVPMQWMAAPIAVRITINGFQADGKPKVLSGKIHYGLIRYLSIVP